MASVRGIIPEYRTFTDAFRSWNAADMVRAILIMSKKVWCKSFKTSKWCESDLFEALIEKLNSEDPESERWHVESDEKEKWITFY